MTEVKAAPAHPVPDGLRAGETRKLDASTPLLLESVEQAWLLESGEVDLFVVPTDAAGDPGDVSTSRPPSPARC